MRRCEYIVPADDKSSTKGVAIDHHWHLVRVPGHGARPASYDLPTEFGANCFQLYILQLILLGRSFRTLGIVIICRFLEI